MVDINLNRDLARLVGSSDSGANHPRNFEQVGFVPILDGAGRDDRRTRLTQRRVRGCGRASAGLVVLSEAEANAGPTQVPTIFTLKCLSTDAIGLRSAIVPPESPANRSPTACGHPLMGFVTTSEPESPGWTKIVPGSAATRICLTKVATPPLPPLHSFVYKTSILTSSAKTVPVVRQ